MPHIGELQPAVLAETQRRDAITVANSTTSDNHTSSAVAMYAGGHQRTLHLDASAEQWTITGPEGDEIIHGELIIDDTYRIGPPHGHADQDEIRAVGLRRAAERLVDEVANTVPE